MTESPTDALVVVLESARDRGLLGPGPVDAHVAHAEAYARVVPYRPGRVVDLGSGAGLPGLVLARCWPDAELVLVDAAERRVAFLQAAIEALGLGDRVRAHHARAENLGRDPDHRATFDLAVARAFGPPAVTAECGAPLLRVDMLLVVSEPPEPTGERWDAEGLDELGLRLDGVTSTIPHLAVLRQVAPCPDRYPRRPGMPAKRPLF